MTRSITAAVSTELQQSAIRPRILVHFAFDSGSVRLWDDIGDLSWNGDTYTGTGDLGSVGPIGETAQLRANGVSFSLTGIPSSLVNTALTEHYQGRTAQMWLALLDGGHNLINDPVPIFAGRIDQMVITDAGETAEIQLSAENRLVDLERPLQTRFYTDQDQQTEFAGDKGFEFVTAMQETVIVWGRARLETSPNAPPSADTDAAGAGEPVSFDPGLDAPGLSNFEAARVVESAGIDTDGSAD